MRLSNYPKGRHKARPYLKNQGIFQYGFLRCCADDGRAKAIRQQANMRFAKTYIGK
jgi:hypothetical protein